MECIAIVLQHGRHVVDGARQAAFEGDHVTGLVLDALLDALLRGAGSWRQQRDARVGPRRCAVAHPVNHAIVILIGQAGQLDGEEHLGASEVERPAHVVNVLAVQVAAHAPSATRRAQRDAGMWGARCITLRSCIRGMPRRPGRRTSGGVPGAGLRTPWCWK